MQFINRRNELQLLQELLDSPNAELLIVYGRRRVGKTELLRHFSRQHRHVFFTATQTTDKNLLSQWSQMVWEAKNGTRLPDFTFPDWESSLRYLTTSVDERLVVVWDEFPYLVDANPALPSILQKVWDDSLRQHNLLWVLCGSSIGMMEQHALNHSSPLYGRRTAQLLLPPLDFSAARQFFPQRRWQSQVEHYAILGGVPAYLQRFAPRRSLATNVVEHILTPNRFLFDEPLFLLRTELREPRNYFAILQAIAHGNTRPNAIAQASGVGDARTISKYLSVLQELHLVSRVVPVTEPRPDKSRQGIYRLADNFLRFWFRFVAPHRGELEQGQAQRVWEEHIQPQLTTFVGQVFEEICRQRLWELARAGRLPFTPQQVGSWWTRTAEIDLAAIDRSSRSLLVGECKWRSRPVGSNVLAELRAKAESLRQGQSFEHVYYALGSRSGFTADIQEAAKRGDVLLLHFDSHPATSTGSP